MAALASPIVRVSRMVGAGCRVVFQPDKGDIAHEASGRRIPIVKRHGAHVLELTPHAREAGGWA